MQELRELWNKWDPIGVSPNDNDVLDEYDFYLVSTLLLLKEVTTIDEIENYLNLLLEERNRHSNPHEFVNKLHVWFRKFN